MEAMSLFYFVGPLLCGWILDRILGDPSWLPHPVVGFGKLISFFERHWNRGKQRRFKGGLMAFILIGGIFAVTFALIVFLNPYPMWSFIVRTILIFYCLAGTTLGKEVRMVFESFSQGLDAARKQVGRIVGRDTASLSEKEIKAAALETLAENLSDGVVAPLFWYVLLGVPGMMAYKMINTLDSMTGYKNDRYREFGCVAARTDDVANFIPARLTAFLIALAGGNRAFSFIRKYGRCHASPNSGYPEAALAGVLDCRFGGTHSYFGKDFYKPYIGEMDRNFTDSDMRRSLRVCVTAETIMVFLSIALKVCVVPVISFL